MDGLKLTWGDVFISGCIAFAAACLLLGLSGCASAPKAAPTIWAPPLDGQTLYVCWRKAEAELGCMPMANFMAQMEEARAREDKL